MSDDESPRCPNCGTEVSRYASICFNCFEDLVAADEFESPPAPDEHTGSPDAASSGAGDADSSGIDAAETGISGDASVDGRSDSDTAETDTAESAEGTGADETASEFDAGESATEVLDEEIDGSVSAEEFDAVANAEEFDASSRTTGTGSTTDTDSSTETRSTTDSFAGVDLPAGADESESEQLLDPDGLADNTLTVVVGIIGGIVVGTLGTIGLLLVTTHWIGFLIGFVGWLATTAYFVRQRTVQGALTRALQALALVLLIFPFIWLGPGLEGGGLGGRLILFVVSLVVVAIPAAVLAGASLLVARTIPDAGEQ